MLVHRRATPALNLPVPIYTPWWREGLWELSVLPKSTTQCARPGFEPGPLDPESSTLTMRPPRLPDPLWCMGVKSVILTRLVTGSLSTLTTSPSKLSTRNTWQPHLRIFGGCYWDCNHVTFSFDTCQERASKSRMQFAVSPEETNLTYVLPHKAFARQSTLKIWTVLHLHNQGKRKPWIHGSKHQTTKQSVLKNSLTTKSPKNKEKKLQNGWQLDYLI